MKGLFERLSWVDLILAALRIGIIVLVIVGASNTLISQKYTSAQWVSLIVSGMAQGSIYALIALGYTLVYGILLMINFAHGEVFMAGAFTAYFAADAFARAELLNGSPAITVLVILVLLVLLRLCLWGLLFC